MFSYHFFNNYNNNNYYYYYFCYIYWLGTKHNCICLLRLEIFLVFVSCLSWKKIHVLTMISYYYYFTNNRPQIMSDSSLSHPRIIRRLTSPPGSIGGDSQGEMPERRKSSGYHKRWSQFKMLMLLPNMGWSNTRKLAKYSSSSYHSKVRVKVVLWWWGRACHVACTPLPL